MRQDLINGLLQLILTLGIGGVIFLLWYLIDSRRLPRIITLNITEEAAQKAGWYEDNENCLAATAFKLQFPNVKFVSCGPCSIHVRRWLFMQTYDMLSTPARHIRRAYDIDGLHIKESFTPFSVTLIKE